jgi:hypothetical protein
MAQVPSRANLAIYQGDDYTGVVTVTNGSPTPPDLSTYSAQAQIRDGPADSNPTVVVEIALTVAGNQIALAIPAAQTVTLTNGPYAWDLQLTPAAGAPIQTILAGAVNVTLEVTRGPFDGR